MATSYVGYRNVLTRGVFPLSTTHDRYAPYSTTGVLAGFPDKPLTDAYNRLFGNAKIPMNWQPLDDPGDRAGALKPNPLFYYGTPSSKVLSGDTGWDTDPTDAYIYNGLGGRTVLEDVASLDTDPIDYYHQDRVGPGPMEDPGRTELIEPTYEDELNVWHGVPSSRAL
jgi:hypothetical protein